MKYLRSLKISLRSPKRNLKKKTGLIHKCTPQSQFTPNACRPTRQLEFSSQSNTVYQWKLTAACSFLMWLLKVANLVVLLFEHNESPRIQVCTATGPVSFRDFL